MGLILNAAELIGRLNEQVTIYHFHLQGCEFVYLCPDLFI